MLPRTDVQNVTADVPERNNRGQRDPPITAEFNLPIIMPIVVTPDGANGIVESGLCLGKAETPVNFRCWMIAVILSSAFQSHPWIVNAKRDPGKPLPLFSRFSAFPWLCLSLFAHLLNLHIVVPWLWMALVCSPWESYCSGSYRHIRP